MSATYNVSDIEIEEPPPIYDKDAKNKAEELNRKNLYVNFFSLIYPGSKLGESYENMKISKCCKTSCSCPFLFK